MENRNTVKGSYLYYKNKPLVREKDTICYGDFTESCILLFEIMSYTDVEGEKVPGIVLVQILSTKDGSIIKQAQKEGMYEAFNYGMFWYEKALSDNN